MDSKQQIKQAVQVSKLYYLDGVTQAEIGKKLNLSRPTISRLLQFAREKNIATVKIANVRLILLKLLINF